MSNSIVVGVDPMHEDREPLAFAAAVATEDNTTALEAAERVARAAARELAGPAEATIEAVDANPVSALVRRSEVWDLLVCGSRGYGPLRTVLLGSVSRSLSHQAKCPLLVLPRDAKPVLDALLAGTVSAGA